MKKKESDARQQKSEEKDAPIDFPPPDPMQLAKLAAILLPTFGPKYGLKRAMEFYFEAVLFSRELPTDFDALLRAFGSGERCNARMSGIMQDALHEREVNTLKLEPDKDYDEARRFLDEQARLAGLIGTQEHFLQSARSVRDNLRDYYESIPSAPLTAKYHLKPDRFFERFKCKENGRVVYKIPVSWLASLVEYKKDRSSEVRKKGWVTKKKGRKRFVEKTVNKNLQPKQKLKRLR
jgi:hypothetical protein